MSFVGNRIEKGSRTALITGASMGIGRCYALQLAESGYNTILVGLGENDLQNVAEQIQTTYGVKVYTLCKNLATTEAATEVYNWVQEQNLKVDVLINNAGIFSYCDLIATPTNRLNTILLLHTYTPTMLCQVFGKDMADKGEGYILNMSSYACWTNLPGLTMYSCTKEYLRTFSVAYAREMREKGVVVTAVCPAGIATSLYGLPEKWQKFALHIGALITPESCVNRALKSLWKGKRCVVPDWWNRIFLPILRHMPEWLIDFIYHKTKLFQK